MVRCYYNDHRGLAEWGDNAFFPNQYRATLQLCESEREEEQNGLTTGGTKEPPAPGMTLSLRGYTAFPTKYVIISTMAANVGFRGDPWG